MTKKGKIMKLSRNFSMHSLRCLNFPMKGITKNVNNLKGNILKKLIDVLDRPAFWKCTKFGFFFDSEKIKIKYLLFLLHAKYHTSFEI